MGSIQKRNNNQDQQPQLLTSTEISERLALMGLEVSADVIPDMLSQMNLEGTEKDVYAIGGALMQIQKQQIQNQPQPLPTSAENVNELAQTVIDAKMTGLKKSAEIAVQTSSSVDTLFEMVGQKYANLEKQHLDPLADKLATFLFTGNMQGIEQSFLAMVGFQRENNPVKGTVLDSFWGQNQGSLDGSGEVPKAIHGNDSTP